MLQQDTEKTSFPPFAIHPSFGKLSTDAWLAQISAWTTLVQRNEDPSLPVLQFSSVSQSCPIHCDPMDCSTPGLPVPHHLLDLAHIHVHCIGDAMQPFHPLMPSEIEWQIFALYGFYPNYVFLYVYV
jgi:hypothetical protein